MKVYKTIPDFPLYSKFEAFMDKYTSTDVLLTPLLMSIQDHGKKYFDPWLERPYQSRTFLPFSVYSKFQTDITSFFQSFRTEVMNIFSPEHEAVFNFHPYSDLLPKLAGIDYLRHCSIVHEKNEFLQWMTWYLITRFVYDRKDYLDISDRLASTRFVFGSKPYSVIFYLFFHHYCQTKIAVHFYKGAFEIFNHSYLYLDSYENLMLETYFIFYIHFFHPKN